MLILSTMSSEIVSYWNSAGGTQFGREVTLSLAWAISATVIVVIGLWRRYSPIRRLAIVVFGLTTLKAFTVDLALLDSLYRVASVLGLGVTLLVTSYLYQRFLMLSRDEVH